MASPVGDGGQWDMVANLVQKYGLVPHSFYPDSYSATSSSTMDRLITAKLREDAVRLRAIAASTASPDSITARIAGEKEKMLREIHLILTLMLGPPPPPDKAFTWEYYDSEGTLRTLRTRPTALAKELSLFSLVNDPRNPYNRLLSVKRLGNLWNGRPVTYVNVDMKTIKEACIAMLKRGMPVLFGSDVGKYSDSSKGILDTDLFEYELGFKIKLENSWSDRVGDKGYFVMSDAWMDEFVYQAVVDPSVVSSTVKKVLEQKPKMLELWDPMGALA
ncbi:cysteine proteinase [Bimuria novae-zelandiae CBS 107.79]|uniref:Cysteine proteinase n=1 Tax=Bimuria novae-zelandiae CBS 107.79 TaxID=1447943 RepID=A0A6A5VLT4_9PLEO|nr:cysteine proteinase [Bimuria novae-zelandiae CBS 107.79]